MSGSGARSWRYGRRWLAVGVALVAVAIAGIVIATQNGPNKSRRSAKSLPVFVVLAHSAVHAGSLDTIEAVNESRYRVDMNSCGAHMTPRMSAGFGDTRGLNCGSDTPIAPHSHLFLGNPSLSPGSKPGKYWVWFSYVRDGRHPAQHTAYTKLLVLAPLPSPPVFVVLAHATIRVGSRDAVEIVNNGGFSAGGSGYGCGPSVSPRTSAEFRRPGDAYCLGGGPTIAPHSSVRVATTIQSEPPGNYWVWFDYFYTSRNVPFTAYTKLTVLSH